MRASPSVRTLLPALCAALALPLAGAAPALAEPGPGLGAGPVQLVQFRSASFGLCIFDTPGGGHNYRLRTCDGDELHQLFTREVLGDGSVVYKGVASGQCVDNDGTWAYSHACNSGDFQHWWEKNKAGPVVTLQNKQTLNCLDTDGDAVFVRDCGEFIHPNQRWQIVPAR